MNRITIHDTLYEITPAYREGALAMRERVTWHANPYEDGSQEYADWDAGHTHEAAGEHFRFGVDIITYDPNAGREFEMDPDVPREENGDVAAEFVRSIEQHHQQSPSLG